MYIDFVSYKNLYFVENQWILVDLAKNEEIYGVATQGKVGGNGVGQWVTSYSISYKTNIDENFRNIENESGATVVSFNFSKTLLTIYEKLKIKS